MEKIKFSLGDTLEYQQWADRMLGTVPPAPEPTDAAPVSPALSYAGYPARPVGMDANGMDVLLMLGGPQKGQRMTRA